MNIAICGSMAFSKEIVEIADKLKQNSHKVIIPDNTYKYVDGSLAMENSYEAIKNKIDGDLIRKYFNVIKNSDAILIVNLDKNGISNYIGGNTFLEIGFAHVLDKLIFFINPIPDMLYTDEIKAMEPIIINNDLSKINYV